MCTLAACMIEVHTVIRGQYVQLHIGKKYVLGKNIGTPNTPGIFCRVGQH